MYDQEIYDLCQEDILNYVRSTLFNWNFTYRLQYPKLCREEVGIYVIQSRDHILNTYSEGISKYAEAKFNRDGVKVILNARVKEVRKDCVRYTAKEKNEKGETVFAEKDVSTNFVLWCDMALPARPSHADRTT